MKIHILHARATPLACAIALLVSFGANAQTAPGGGAGTQPGTSGAAQPSSPSGVQSPSQNSAQPGQTPGAQPPSPPGSEPGPTPSAQRPTPSSQSDIAQPTYPSSDPPRGTTPQQRERLQQQGAAGSTESNIGMCNQEDELARNECLRRDMTDDDDLPAGVTRSMHQRRQAEQAEKRAEQDESMNVASEADTGSDQAGARSRTRTASSSLPDPQDQAEQDRGNDARDAAEQPSTEANNDSDTLGSER